MRTISFRIWVVRGEQEVCVYVTVTVSDQDSQAQLETAEHLGRPFVLTEQERADAEMEAASRVVADLRLRADRDAGMAQDAWDDQRKGEA